MYRVLIVDDEPMIRKGLEKMVRLIEPSVTSIDSAQDGEEALARIRERRPQFLFTDIRMPVMDGLELCGRIAEEYPDIAVVVISGYGDFEYAQKCVSFGVKEYLLKPVSKTGMRAALDKLIALAGKKSAPELVSVTRINDWVDRIETAIWLGQQPVLRDVLDEWKAEYDRYPFSAGQKNKLIVELFGMLVKKLISREIISVNAELCLVSDDSPEEAFDRFRHEATAFQLGLIAKRKGKAKDPVEEAKAHIERNLSKEVPLEEVADMLGLNSSYFSQLFKQATGETFVHYRTRRRMEKAKKLLEQPQFRITDISYEVGYADHPHFTKTFKKYAGLSPSEYRSQLGID